MAGLLTVQNMEGNRTLFEQRDGRGIIEWQRAGDPMGEDVQQVSEDVAQDRDFIKACARGVLRVLDDESGEITEAQQRLADQITKFRSARSTSEDEIMGRLDRPQDRSIMSYECIAPLGGGSQCGQAVMMRLTDAKEQPPLCSRHKALQNSFVANDVGSAGSEGDKPSTRWSYAGVSR